MKKALVFVFIFISGILVAQNRLIDPEMYVGINYGKVGSMVMFSPAVNQTYTLGNNGGLVFRYIAEKNVGVQIELNYSQRGWKEADYLYERQLNYIELPFMTHIYIGNKSRFFFNLGPKISYLLSDKELINSVENPTAHEQITPIENSFDYGVCTGLGYMFKIKKQIIQLDTRAAFSISDIYSNKKRDYFDSSKNMSVSINFSWLYQLK